MKSDHKIPLCKCIVCTPSSLSVRDFFLVGKEMLGVIFLASAPYLNRQLDEHGKAHERKTKSSDPDPK